MVSVEKILKQINFNLVNFNEKNFRPLFLKSFKIFYLQQHCTYAHKSKLFNHRKNASIVEEKLSQKRLSS